MMKTANIFGKNTLGFLVATGILLAGRLNMLGQADQVIYANDFEHVAGPEWSNTATDVTPVGGRRFLGQFGNQTVRLNLANLPAHNHATISLDLFVIRTWDGNDSRWGWGPDIWSLSVADRETLLSTTFCTHELVMADMGRRMQSFPDFGTNNSHPPLTGASEVNSLGFAWGSCGVMDSIYRLTFDFPHTNSILQFDFSGSGLQELGDESWGLDNVKVSTGMIPANSPPVFITQPPSGLFLDGTSVVLSATISSLEPIALHWQLNGTNVPGATNQYLALDRLSTTNAGGYTLVAANPYGVVTSAVAQVSVARRPQNQIVAEWAKVVFDGEAVGNGPFAYQWLLNGNDIPNATNEVLSFDFAGLDQSGNYSVKVKNADGQIVTPPAKLVVNAPVNVAIYRTDFESGAGIEWSDRSTTVTPIGARRFLGEYANQKVALTLTNLPPHTEVNLCFDLFIIQTWDGNEPSSGPDIFRVNSVGDPPLLETTFAYTLTGHQQAFPKNYPEGSYVAATGAAENGTLGYRTYTPNTNIDYVYGLNFQFQHSSNSLTIEFSGEGLEGVGNEGWGLDNVVVSLANVPANAPPTITSLPKNQIVLAGETAIFSVQATTGSPLNYQWRLNGTNLPDATNAMLVLTNIAASQAGDYSVQVANPFGSVTRMPASLGVVTMQPQGQTVNAGGTATFEIEAYGPGLMYQWRFNSQDVPGAINSRLILTNVQPAQAGDYRMLVSVGAISLLTQAAILSVPIEGEPGSKLWEFQAQDAIYGSVTVAPDETLNAMTWGGQIVTLTPQGQIMRMTNFSELVPSVSTLSIGNNGTLYSMAFNRLFCMYAEGSLAWWKALEGDGLACSSPSIALDGTIYCSAINPGTTLHAFSPGGSNLWSYDSGGRILSSTAIGPDGTVYFGTLDNNKFVAINPNGTRKWEYTTGNWIYSSPAIGEDGTVYFGSLDHRFYAINPDGTIRWVFQADWAILSSPCIGKAGTIYFSAANRLYAINPSGTLKWSVQVEDSSSDAGGYITGPAVSQRETIYFRTDNLLHAIDRNGARLWSFSMGGKYFAHMRPSPTIGRDGTVYIGDANGTVYAIQGDGTGPANSSWPMFRRNAEHTGRLPAIVQTQQLSVSPGASATFRVTTGETNLVCQWYHNGTPIADATNATITIAPVTANDVGNYTVAVIWNGVTTTYDNMSLDVDASFTKITTGPVVEEVGDSVGCAWGDYDNDGFLDLIVANAALQDEFLYHNNGQGSFTKIMTGPVVTSGLDSVGAAWADYDNNGILDLFIANFSRQNNFLYRNDGKGIFTAMTNGSIVNDGGISVSCAWGDYDNDGNLDLFVCNYGQDLANFLYLNHGNTNHWLKVRLIGTRSNRSGIGAKIRVKAHVGGRDQWQLREISGGGTTGQGALEAHFGLAEATPVELLRIEWPSGIVQELNNVPVNQSLTLTEPPVLWIGNGMTKEGFEMILTSRGGFNYLIESSSNLINWHSLTTVSNVNGAVQVVDPHATNWPHRFYRASAIPSGR